MISNQRSYLIVAESKKLILEAENRKKLRRISRKKYPKEYMQTKEYIIVSGDTLKEGIASLKTMKTTSRPEKKEVKKTKNKDKKTKVKKVTINKPDKLKSLKERIEFDETKQIERMNKRNAKMQELF